VHQKTGGIFRAHFFVFIIVIIFSLIIPSERFQKLGVAICFFIANIIFYFYSKGALGWAKWFSKPQNGREAFCHFYCS